MVSSRIIEETFAAVVVVACLQYGDYLQDANNDNCGSSINLENILFQDHLL